MAELISNKIKRSLLAAEDLYHHLVLLVGVTASGKTDALLDVSEAFESPIINVNLCLAKELLELTTKQRQLKLPEILSQAINDKGEVVFLDNIEILFDVGLKQDPLRLLQGLSRNLTLVASWNGNFDKGKLTYSEPEHCEYRSYDLTDTLVVSMNGDATVDFKQSSEDKLL